MTELECKSAFEDREYIPTGNPAVDMIAGCINFHKNHIKILDKIYLRNDMYEMFVAWVNNQGYVTSEDQTFEVDNVYVEKSPLNISETMDVVYKKSVEKKDTSNYKKYGLK